MTKPAYIDVSPPEAHNGNKRVAMSGSEMNSISTCSPMQVSPWKGGEECMKRPVPVLRVGVVNIHELGSRRWQIRFMNPATRLEVRRRLSGMDLSEVQRIAAHVSQEVLSGKGLLPDQRQAPLLKDGITEAIRLSKRRDYVKVETARQAGKWIEWMKIHYPRVQTWDQLTPAMLKDYVRDLESSGLSWDSVRLRIAPIKLAWRHVAENHPNEVRPMPRVRQAEREPESLDCLTANEVSILLDWLKSKSPDLHGMACLAALSGLRVWEAAAIRRMDIDFNRGMVTVTDTGFHRPKNRSSYRVVPVCSEVLEALALAIQSQKVVLSTGEVFLSRNATQWTKRSLGSRWYRTLRRIAKQTTYPRFKEIPVKRLRASFVTMASRLGVPDTLLRKALGHQGGDVLNLHYRVVGADELRLVAERMEHWRDLASKRFQGNIQETLQVRSAVSH
jgi:integrase